MKQAARNDPATAEYLGALRVLQRRRATTAPLPTNSPRANAEENFGYYRARYECIGEVSGTYRSVELARALDGSQRRYEAAKEIAIEAISRLKA